MISAVTSSHISESDGVDDSVDAVAEKLKFMELRNRLHLEPGI